MLEDSNFQVTMSEYLPLRDVVFNTLRHAILKGELEPGERLMEIALAQKLLSSEPVMLLMISEFISSSEATHSLSSFIPARFLQFVIIP